VRYAEAVRYLYALSPRGVKLGLGRVEAALAQRGHPERAFRSVLVAGTNGKGSVAAMLASVLRSAGFRVGLYTSPHLHRLVERFRVDGRAIGQAELARRVTELSPWLERSTTPGLTFFEVCTLIAFEVFRDHAVDVAVLEVGLGGRLDATNVVQPELGVITRVALDHADRLGPTLTHIAREKAGIMRAGVPLVCGVSEPSALRVVRARARRLSAPLLILGRDFSAARIVEARGAAREQNLAAPGRPPVVPEAPARYRVRLGERELSPISLALAGAYQADNLACAVAALAQLRAAGFAIPDRALRAGLRRVRWPGRLELVTGARGLAREQGAARGRGAARGPARRRSAAAGPDVLLDAAHNPDACLALAAHLRTLRARYGRIVLLFGVLADKDHADMLRILLPAVDGWLFATPPTPRALAAARLREQWGGAALDDPSRALARARRMAGKRGLLVVAGSMFLMAQVRAALLGLRSDPPIAM
jgi:dihydrofolate synthase/folylpolyglutamate synthase